MHVCYPPYCLSFTIADKHFRGGVKLHSQRRPEKISLRASNASLEIPDLNY